MTTNERTMKVFYNRDGSDESLLILADDLATARYRTQQRLGSRVQILHVEPVDGETIRPTDQTDATGLAELAQWYRDVKAENWSACADLLDRHPASPHRAEHVYNLARLGEDL